MVTYRKKDGSVLAVRLGRFVVDIRARHLLYAPGWDGRSSVTLKRLV